MLFVLLITGHNSPSINSWKLDTDTLKFQLKGALPYAPSLLESQPQLLQYILKQQYSREMVFSVIDIQKKVIFFFKYFSIFLYIRSGFFSMVHLFDRLSFSFFLGKATLSRAC